MSIKATKGRVLVKRANDPEMIGSIVVPEPRAHAKWCGTVLASGEETECTIGDVVWFERVRMDELEIDGYDCKVTVVDWDDCWGVEVE